jgi:hypothetical protein
LTLSLLPKNHRLFIVSKLCMLKTGSHRRSYE